MEGAALAAKRQFESEITLAWHTAAFNAATKSKRGLKKLDDYLPKRRGREQSAGEMLEILREFQARGAKMDIKRVN